MAEALNMKLEHYMAINYLDETAIYYHPTGCAGILVRMPDGDVAHVRHLDYDPANLLRPLVYHGKFYKQGESG